jgi:hypothetical protein
LRFWLSLSRSRQPENWRRQPVRGTIGAMFRHAIQTTRAKAGPTQALRGAIATHKVKPRENRSGHRSRWSPPQLLYLTRIRPPRAAVKCRHLERWWPSDPGPQRLMAHVILRIRFRSADASRFGHDAAPV